MEQQSNTATQKKGSLLLPILAMACHLLLPVTFMLILMINLMINESLYAALGLGSSALSAWLQTLLSVLQYGLSMLVPLQILAGIVLGAVYLFTKRKRPIGYVLSIGSIVHPFFWIGLISILFSTGVLRLM